MQIFFLLNVFEGLGAFVYLLTIPSDDKQILLFGLSPARLALAAALLLATLIFLGLFTASTRFGSRLIQFTNWLSRIMTRQIVFWISNLGLLLVTVSALSLIALGPGRIAVRYQAYLVRLLPLVIWVGLIALQTMTLLFVAYFHLHQARVRYFFLRFVGNHILFYTLLPIGAVFTIYLTYKLSSSSYIFTDPEYRRYFWYYLVQAAIPLTYFFVPGKARVNTEIKAELEKLWRKFKAHWKLFLIAWICFAAIYLYLGYNAIPTLNARALRFLEREPPFIPIEPMLGMLLSFELNWVMPAELVSPMISLFAFTLIYLFFIFVNEEDASIIPLTMLFILTNSWIVYFSLMGNIELIPAVFGFLGMFSIMRRRYSLGAILLMIGAMIKASTLFFVIPAALVIGYHIIRDRRTLKELNYAVAFIAAFYALWALFGIYLYITNTHGSADYLFTSKGYIIWVTPALRWINQFFGRYIYLTLISLLAFFYKGKYRNTALTLFVLVFIARNISRLWGGYYILFYIPQLVFLTFLGISFLFRTISSHWPGYVKWFVIGALIVTSVTQWTTETNAYNTTINRFNSNLIELVTQMAAELPREVTVVQRRISIKLYFDRLGRDDIQYFNYSENRERTLQGLQESGCIVLLSRQDDLKITDTDLKAIGYQQIYDLQDDTGVWRLWLKDCD
ncbi:MAG: hypothetical protein JXB38_10745 [Anaerolineales bacterium]|nr:hypothetical protein [Anaerolineales bacterium]